MVNPFSGIIRPELKVLFRNMINALLEDTALTVPCKVVYGGSKFEVCENCVYDPIGKKSANKYVAGGPMPFRNGSTCPVCQGTGGGVRETITTETIYLCVIFDHKKWLNVSDEVLKSPESYAQTLCKNDYISKLVKAKEIVLNTDFEPRDRHTFQRVGDPKPVGFGSDDYIVTTWKKIGG